jgi:amino-acid N-acetyltransferase
MVSVEVRVPVKKMQTTIRKATEADVEHILRIVNHYAAQNIMLWRTAEQVRQVLPGFVVAEENGRIMGCGSLVELTPQLTEVRSLAVDPDYQGRGLGSRIVGELVEMARAAGYDQVCALTLREGFFNAQGFETVDRWALAPKIWHECVYCPKFRACDEIAVLMNLTQPAEVPDRRRIPWSLPRRLRPGLGWQADKS